MVVPRFHRLFEGRDEPFPDTGRFDAERPLEAYARDADLVVVAADKGETARLLPSDAARSAHDAPQRALALTYVRVPGGLMGAFSPGGDPAAHLATYLAEVTG